MATNNFKPLTPETNEHDMASGPCKCGAWHDLPAFNPTPGPWRVVGDDVIGFGGNIVAQCCGYSDKATDPNQRRQGGRESNARLIAAAPALLAACKALLAERLSGITELPTQVTIGAADALALAE